VEDAARMEQVIRRTAVIAHDFNNLLTAINGYADLVAGMVDPGQPMAAYVDEVRKAGAKAADLTQELLSLSRLQDGSIFHQGSSASST
jgi:two-component system, cell cycle sensor histidine kinase and response regulator CckA